MQTKSRAFHLRCKVELEIRLAQVDLLVEKIGKGEQCLFYEEVQEHLPFEIINYFYINVIYNLKKNCINL